MTILLPERMSDPEAVLCFTTSAFLMPIRELGLPCCPAHKKTGLSQLCLRNLDMYGSCLLNIKAVLSINSYRI